MKLRNVFAMITAAAMTLSLAACSGSEHSFFHVLRVKRLFFVRRFRKQCVE